MEKAIKIIVDTMLLIMTSVILILVGAALVFESRDFLWPPQSPTDCAEMDQCLAWHLLEERTSNTELIETLSKVNITINLRQEFYTGNVGGGSSNYDITLGEGGQLDDMDGGVSNNSVVVYRTIRPSHASSRHNITVVLKQVFHNDIRPADDQQATDDNDLYNDIA